MNFFIEDDVIVCNKCKQRLMTIFADDKIKDVICKENGTHIIKFYTADGSNDD